MSNALRQQLLKLSAAERLELVGELWDSIADDDEALALTDEQREDLERRLAEATADPTGGSPLGRSPGAHPAPPAVTLSLQVRRRAERDVDEAHACHEQQVAGLGLRNAQGIQRVPASKAGPRLALCDPAGA